MGHVLQSLDHSPYDPLFPERKKTTRNRAVSGPEMDPFRAGFEAQMAEQDRLIRDRNSDVIASVDGYLKPAQELWEHVIDHLGEGYRVLPDMVVRPDGVQIALTQRTL